MNELKTAIREFQAAITKDDDAPLFSKRDVARTRVLHKQVDKLRELLTDFEKAVNAFQKAPDLKTFGAMVKAYDRLDHFHGDQFTQTFAEIDAKLSEFGQ